MDDLNKISVLNSCIFVHFFFSSKRYRYIHIFNMSVTSVQSLSLVALGRADYTNCYCLGAKNGQTYGQELNIMPLDYMINSEVPDHRSV